MEKLFVAVQTAYDPKNKPVHLCITEDGKSYVYKPSSGFKSKVFDAADDEALLAIFARQRHDGQTFASYLPGEADDVMVENKVPRGKKK
jgi:hypothetical protein